MPTTAHNFLQLKHDYITFQQTWPPTVLFWAKKHDHLGNIDR